MCVDTPDNGCVLIPFYPTLNRVQARSVGGVKMSRKLKVLARIPVVLAVVGAYLNSATVLAEFQPEGRAWVGYIAALSLSVSLYLSVEAFLFRPNWIAASGIFGFGLAEVAGQILHAALLRGDVVVMTPLLRWVMGYLSPSFVVLVGLSLPFIAHWGFGLPSSADVSPEVLVLRSEIAALADVVRQQGTPPSGGRGRRMRSGTRSTGAAPAVAAGQLPLPSVGGANGKTKVGVRHG